MILSWFGPRRGRYGVAERARSRRWRGGGEPGSRGEYFRPTWLAATPRGERCVCRWPPSRRRTMQVQGRLKLIDFGIARAIKNDTTNIYRDTQIGTLNYMSPEAIRDSGAGPPQPSGKRRPTMKVGRASDVWSLGCILYQMVYGKTPFGDLHLYAKLQAITDARHAISTPANTPLATPDALDCVRGCLEREPSQRLEISALLCHAFLDPRSSKITSAQIQKAVHDALSKQDCKVDADKLAKDVSASLLDEPQTLAAAIAGVTLQSASLPNKYQKDKAEQQPDGLAGLMQRGFAQMAPVAEEGTGGSDMDVTATNASGWTTGV